MDSVILADTDRVCDSSFRVSTINVLNKLSSMEIQNILWDKPACFVVGESTADEHPIFDGSIGSKRQALGGCSTSNTRRVGFTESSSKASSAFNLTDKFYVSEEQENKVDPLFSSLKRDDRLCAFPSTDLKSFQIYEL